MSIIKLTVNVAQIANVLTLFDKIQVQRSKLGDPYTDATFITATAATSPIMTGTETAPYSFLQGTTLGLQINGGDTQTVTFIAANPISLASVISTFNGTVSGATASDDGYGKLKLTGTNTGTDGTILIVGGTSLSILGFSTDQIAHGQDAHISLASGTSAYQYDDSSGAVTYYYRTRYFNSTSEVFSSWSSWELGTPDDATGAQIGDEPTITYTTDEITGINILLAQLKARLKNNLEVESTDEFGNITFVSCSVFTNEELTWFLRCSLSEFNQTPHFTDFTFDLEVIYDRFAYIIIEGAFILATAAQMLIEAGREFTITDNGITMNPPPLSSVLNNELSQFVARHTEMLHKIKWSIKPQPTGFGGFRVLAVSPNFMRLRHLRQRRIV
jgi:hypothetical protein